MDQKDKFGMKLKSEGRWFQVREDVEEDGETKGKLQEIQKRKKNGIKFGKFEDVERVK